MQRVPAVVASLLVVMAAAYVGLNRTDGAAGRAPPLAGAPASAALLARGEYLTRAADCVACHTVAESGQPFAGGVAFKLPIGTIYSSNITADPIHGIGAWSDAQFLRALHDGIGRHGEHLYPAFPYTSYTKLSRADVLAVKAYLFSLPAIPRANRANELGFPFNQRWAVGFWNAVFFENRRFVADESKPPEWNSGAYLATALGHCGECHTPRNLAFGLRHGEEFAGAELQGWRAYNITPQPRYGIGAWSDAELASYLHAGLAVGHGSAGGPMGEAVAHSLQYLDAVDVGALIAYLRSVAAREGQHPVAVESQPVAALASTNAAPGGGAASGGDSEPGGGAAHPQAQGLRLFAGACASCHQWNGQGQQSPYAALLGTRGVNDVEGANVIRTILEGANMRIGDRDVFMPAFGRAYSNTEVAALANYVIAQFGGKRGVVTPEAVARRRAL
jgi:mono/diheme cytochrome c family protein